MQESFICLAAKLFVDHVPYRFQPLRCYRNSIRQHQNKNRRFLLQADLSHHIDERVQQPRRRVRKHASRERFSRVLARGQKLENVHTNTVAVIQVLVDAEVGDLQRITAEKAKNEWPRCLSCLAIRNLSLPQTPLTRSGEQ